MTINQIASGILNDLWGGNLIPLANRALISVEQLEDEVIEERSVVIRDLYLKNLLPAKELATAINCVELDCENINRCPCRVDITGEKKVQHFQIPQLMAGLGKDAIIFIGSTDREVSYRVYYNLESVKYQKYRKNGSDRPYVYIEPTPNSNGMCDGWLFNAPFAKVISIIAIFKDPRDLECFSCDVSDSLELGSVSNEIMKRILAKKIQLYRTPTITPTQTS